MKTKAEEYNSSLIDEIFESISPKEKKRIRSKMLLAAKIEDAMTEDAKKVWKVMETEFEWSNEPEGFHLEYFENIIESTKQALTIPDVEGQSEQLRAFKKFCQDNYSIAISHRIIDEFERYGS